ncbi:hypothetical protein [Serratia liquefaciens]|uniref:hypothetical protein n=1 Tax=Serratia liquefaciens TaxID=614 RepID=UPI002182BCA7|nr:hypothetical protein [Serratia liquefaciens]CAI2448098.1 putative diguanylate cyclase [Serratia liquefaciens]
MHTTELPGATKLQHALIVFLLVFGLCLFGIVSRPTGLLSSFWPANAVLLALLVRYPALASPWGWLMAILGYMAADLITGSTVVKAALLNGANITGVAVGFFLFMRLSPPGLRCCFSTANSCPPWRCGCLRSLPITLP